jgi:PAS domain S-box-containing protein
MNNSIKILVIDDSAIGAEAIVRALAGTGRELASRVVMDRTSLAQALDSGSWDVVISDYVMDGFSGLDALRMCQERGLDGPFICVSGEIGEEEAAAIVRAGAHDFISKSHLVRLGPVVIRELAAAETRRHHRQVEQLTTHLAAIVEGTDDAIFSRDVNGTILTWNSAAQAMYGYTPEEAIGRLISIIVPPEFTHELVEILNKLKGGQRIERMEAERMRKDGSRLHVSMTISPVKNERGQVIGASIIARDITRRWQLERERENLINELQEALSKVKLLSGLLPICANCKKIRDTRGNWQPVEVYVHEHSLADFTHGICPECAHQLYPEIDLKNGKTKAD